MTTANVDTTVLEELQKYDTPTVLNAIELFKARPRHEGFLDGSIKACFPEMGAVVGYAATATFTSAQAPQKGDAYSNIADQIEAIESELPRPRIVVFQDIDPEPVGATFGEVMCTVYKAFGCSGLITSGGARDLDQVRALGFPCWSSSVISSHAWCRIVDVQVPVEVGGLTIRPGELIHADCNGAAIIPTELAAHVALASRYLAEAEDIVLSWAHNLSGEELSVDGLKETFGAMRGKAGKILERVQAELGD